MLCPADCHSPQRFAKRGGEQWHPASGTVPSLHLPPVQVAPIPPHGGGLMDRPSRSAMCRWRVRTEELICQAQRLRRGVGRGWRKGDFRSAWVGAQGHNKSLCFPGPREDRYCGEANEESAGRGPGAGSLQPPQEPVRRAGAPQRCWHAGPGHFVTGPACALRGVSQHPCLYPLDASRTPHPCHADWKRLQILSAVLGVQNRPRENPGLAKGTTCACPMRRGPDPGAGPGKPRLTRIHSSGPHTRAAAAEESC